MVVCGPQSVGVHKLEVGGFGIPGKQNFDNKEKMVILKESC